MRHQFINILIRLDDKDGVPEPTPTYNSSILEDMFLEENSEFLEKTFSEWKELGDALILLKVWIVNKYCYPVYIRILNVSGCVQIWARQRSFICVHDCMNGFLISVILSYLATHSKINKALNALDIFRVTLGFIGTVVQFKSIPCIGSI